MAEMTSRTAKEPWVQISPRYILASLLTAMGDSYLDTSTIGPVTVMPRYVDYFGSHSSSVHGIIVSSILLSASVTSFFAGRPADILGRPRAIALGAVVFGVGAALEAGAMNLAIFMVGRVIEGMGFGLYFGTLTICLRDLSAWYPRPVDDRSAVHDLVGLVAGYFTCYGTSRIEGSMSWRLPFIILVGLAVAFVTSVLLFLPPSPRWLRLRGRNAEADAAWETLGVKPEDRQTMEEDIAEEREARTSDTETKEQEEHGFLNLFKKDVRERTLLAVFLMGFLQLSGIDAVLYIFPIVRPLLFQQAGLSTQEASFLASGVSGIVLVAISIPALLFADKWGRRTSTILGGLGLTITILLMGILYASNAVHATHGAARWVVIVCIYLYSVFFASTWAVSIKVFAPEIQPQNTRAKATAVAHGANWVCNWFVAFICPILLSRSSYAAYFLFGGCCALTTIVCFFFMVETKGKSLDEIERAFKMRHTSEAPRGVRMGKTFLGVLSGRSQG